MTETKPNEKTMFRGLARDLFAAAIEVDAPHQKAVCDALELILKTLTAIQQKAEAPRRGRPKKAATSPTGKRRGRPPKVRPIAPEVDTAQAAP
jgi:hypothetical protein